MAVQAPTVRRVIGTLSQSQLLKVKSYSEKNRFCHSWYWHGPEGNIGMDYKTIRLEEFQTKACGAAVAFGVEPSTEVDSFWGAKVDENLMNAMAHVSAASGGDVGTVNYILEYTELSHEEFVSIIDDALNASNIPAVDELPREIHARFLDKSNWGFLDHMNRRPPVSRSMHQVPTVRKLLSALSKKQLARILKYSVDEIFHHGWYYFGPEGDVGVLSDEDRFCKEGCGDPLAIAFELTPSRDEKSWRGAKLDERFVEAMRFWAKYAGGEKGMEEYVVELNSLSSKELERLIRSVAAEALGSDGST
jgi:hypothetical protein